MRSKGCLLYGISFSPIGWGATRVAIRRRAGSPAPYTLRHTDWLAYPATHLHMAAP